MFVESFSFDTLLQPIRKLGSRSSCKVSSLIWWALNTANCEMNVYFFLPEHMGHSFYLHLHIVYDQLFQVKSTTLHFDPSKFHASKTPLSIANHSFLPFEAGEMSHKSATALRSSRCRDFSSTLGCFGFYAQPSLPSMSQPMNIASTFFREDLSDNRYVILYFTVSILSDEGEWSSRGIMISNS
jgi:hypothetical protein